MKMKALDKIFLIVVFSLFCNVLFAETLISSIGFQTDFEDEEERAKWILNSTVEGYDCANKWFWGNLGANGGDYGLFISGDYGLTNRYVPIGTTVLAYRTFTFGKGDYELSFDWQAGGLSADGLYVCWIPERDSIELASVSTSSILPEWVERYAIDFNSDLLYLSQRTWNTILDTIYANGEAYNLVFVWNNAVLASYSMGAMIDNLNILEVGRCSRPTNLMANPKGNDMVLSWSGEADAYDVRCVNNLTGESVEYNDVTTKYHVVSDLSEGMCTYYVRSKCGGIAGAWTSISKFLFYPGTRCVDYLDLNNRNCSHGDPINGLKNGAVDLGCQAVDSRHTIHWNPNEYDPFTNGKLKTVPDGALASIRLGNWNIGAEYESVEYNFIVDTTKNAAILLLDYAVLLESPNHDSIDQPRFTLEITHDGKPLDKFGCGEAYFAAGYNTDGWVKFQGPNSEGYYKDWTTVGVNLREYHGKSLKIKLTTFDCTAGGHFGYAYFTLNCSGGKIKGLSCAGDSETIFEGPEGFNYRWYLPSNPDSIVSEKRRLTLPASDTLTYALDVIQPTNRNCYYTLYASAVGRYPCAAADYKPDFSNCTNKVEFINKSYIKRINQVTNDSSITDEPCENFLWDFGDGTMSNEANPVHEYPAIGGSYTVRLLSGIADGKCSDDTTFTIKLPRMDSKPDTIHATVCLGEPYEFPKGKYQFESGFYSDSAVTIYGCDSITVLDLYVAEPYDTLIVDSICSGEEYSFGDEILTKSGRYTAHLESVYGCDSIITLNLVVLETLDISVDSVINQCSNDEFIYLPYILHSGGVEDFKIYFEELNLEYDGYSVEPEAMLVKMPKDLKPDKYQTTIHFGERSCGKEHETITLNLLYPKEVIVQRWGDVLAVVNEDYNGGYKFIAFQWYKDGQIIEGATSSILYEPNGLDSTAEYSVMLTRDDDVMLMTCSADLVVFSDKEQEQVIVFSKNEGRVEFDLPQKAKVKVWSTSGVLLKEFLLNEGVNIVDTLGMHGVYIFEIIFEDNQREIQQVVF